MGAGFFSPSPEAGHLLLVAGSSLIDHRCLRSLTQRSFWLISRRHSPFSQVHRGDRSVRSGLQPVAWWKEFQVV
ncbi:MAG: hypothetical protein CL859_01880 [Cyanobium sp. ARS6]|nr:hypothetical protein [Cyanobium sp. ARS6]